MRSEAALMGARLLLGFILLWSPARAAIPATAEYATWTQASSGSFVVLTDMGMGAATTACRNLALISEALPRTGGALALTSPLPTYVFVLGDHNLFEYCAPQSGNFAALYMPATDRNLILVDGSSPQKWTALNHEYLHSHLRANFPGIPVWLDEGTAEFYSTFKLQNTSVEAGGDLPWHSQWVVQQDLLSIDVLFSFNNGAAVYRQSGIMQHTLYSEGWALVQYLQSSADKADKFDAFIAKYRDGSTPRRAFMEVFPEDGWTALLHDAQAYMAAGFIQPRIWKLREPIRVKDPEVSPVPASDARVSLALLKCLEGGPAARAEAEASCRQLLAERPGEPLCLAGLGFVVDARGDSAQAESLYARVRATTPRPPTADLLVAQGTLTRAFSVIREQNVGQARAIFLRARDRFQQCLAANPNDLAASIGWASSFALDEHPAPEALARLEKASEALPARGDIAFSLFMLQLSSGKKDEASHLLETRLAAILQPADLVSARQLLASVK